MGEAGPTASCVVWGECCCAPNMGTCVPLFCRFAHTHTHFAVGSESNLQLRSNLLMLQHVATVGSVGCVASGALLTVSTQTCLLARMTSAPKEGFGCFWQGYVVYCCYLLKECWDTSLPEGNCCSY